MNKALTEHFRHQWRILESLVDEFDDEAWSRRGRGLTTPPLTAYHLFTSVLYYSGADIPFRKDDGSTMRGSRRDVEPASAPSRREIRANIAAFADAGEAWLSELDLDAANTDFEYAGPTMGDLALFVLRHSEYHLGEISALLNEEMEGESSDHFARTLT